MVFVRLQILRYVVCDCENTALWFVLACIIVGFFLRSYILDVSGTNNIFIKYPSPSSV